MDGLSAIVVDNGSGSIKSGFGGDDIPKSIFPTVVGHPKTKSILLGKNHYFVGEEAQRKEGILQFKYPINNGIITNWDDMETIWHHTFFNVLRIAPEDQPILLSESPLNTKTNREKMVQILFESFSFPGMLVSPQAILSIYASGRTTGVILESGEGMTTATSVDEACALKNSIVKTDISGGELTEYLMKRLMERDLTIDKKIVRELKENLCFLSKDQTEYDLMTSETIQKSYKLPDGTVINLGNELFQCPEIFFQPSLIGRQGEFGIHELVLKSIHQCQMDISKDLYSNIVLSGGSTLFQGISERMTIEMKKLAPSSMKLKIVAPPERKISVWLGGSILSSLSISIPIWLFREDYEESGAGIIHGKCF